LGGQLAKGTERRVTAKPKTKSSKMVLSVNPGVAGPHENQDKMEEQREHTVGAKNSKGEQGGKDKVHCGKGEPVLAPTASLERRGQVDRSDTRADRKVETKKRNDDTKKHGRSTAETFKQKISASCHGKHHITTNTAFSIGTAKKNGFESLERG